MCIDKNINLAFELLKLLANKRKVKSSLISLRWKTKTILYFVVIFG